MNPDDEMVSEESRAEIEQKEDDFVGQTEEAVGVMKNVRFPPSHSLPNSSPRCLVGKMTLAVTDNTFALEAGPRHARASA